MKDMVHRWCNGIETVQVTLLRKTSIFFLIQMC